MSKINQNRMEARVDMFAGVMIALFLLGFIWFFATQVVSRRDQLVECGRGNRVCQEAVWNSLRFPFPISVVWPNR